MVCTRGPLILRVTTPYADDELSLVDGDSLLLHVFSTEKLDFSGFSTTPCNVFGRGLLHALLRRNVVPLIFFADNAHLCIPSSIPSTLLLHASLLDEYQLSI